jgi:hypothetical protein
MEIASKAIWKLNTSLFHNTVRYLLILGSMLFFVSRLLIVTGSEAELEAVPNAVTKALPMFATNLRFQLFKKKRPGPTSQDAKPRV